MRPSHLLLAGLLTGAGAYAGIHGPVMGYVADTTLRALRPVNGIAGAALLEIRWTPGWQWTGRRWIRRAAWR
ncbi:MAG: hypothetical protein R2762_11715 [Bryobacteraceae bacterium]